MFGLGKDRLMYHECKDYLLTSSTRLKPIVKQDSKTRFELQFTRKERHITIALITTNGASVEVDVSDNYYMLRIPRAKFTKKEKCFPYMMDIINKVETALDKT